MARRFFLLVTVLCVVPVGMNSDSLRAQDADSLRAQGADSLRAQGAGEDPFSGEDPFRGIPDPNRPKPKPGEAVNLEFHLTDHENKPVANSRILLQNPKRYRRFPLVITDEQGIARWVTSNDELQQLGGPANRMNLQVIPSREACMPRIYRTLTVAEAKEGKPISLRTRPGIRLHGKVVGKEDQMPVRFVSLYFSATNAPNPFGTNFKSSTDEEGNWSTVIPRVASQIVLGGSSSGYVIGYDKRYRRTIEIPDGENELRVEDFEVEQIPSRKIVVTSEDGEPIAGAAVNAYYERWYNPTYPGLESIAQSEVTDREGTCELTLNDVDWKRGRVSVKVEIDDLAYVGRSAFRPDVSETVHVQVRPRGTIEGRLFNGDAPADGVDLVLYESIDFERVGRRTIGIRGKATTNAMGRFQFPAELETTYIIASAQRDSDSAQLKIHAIDNPLNEFAYRVPDLDLEKIRAEDRQRKAESPKDSN